jgi:hypothetical protein
MPDKDQMEAAHHTLQCPEVALAELDLEREVAAGSEVVHSPAAEGILLAVAGVAEVASMGHADLGCRH